MITLGIKNASNVPEAAGWMPVVYEGGNAHYPSGFETLAWSEQWQTDVTGLVDVRFNIHNASGSAIAWKDANNFTLVDGKTYIFDYATGVLSEPGVNIAGTSMYLALGLGIGAIALAVLALRK